MNEILQFKLLQHVLTFIEGFIWQKGRFGLQLSTSEQAPWQRQRKQARRGGEGQAPPQHPPPPCLWGSIDFADNVEDEWFAVWLLVELTRAFPVTARYGHSLRVSYHMPGGWVR